MELPDLSLAPGLFAVEKSPNSSSSESADSNPIRKRKFFNDHQLLKTESDHQAAHTSVDLQLKDPLPLDWEQCLDLQSGRMYYLNKKTSRKSWKRPMVQKLDLELNISTQSDQQYCSNMISSHTTLEDSKKKYISNSNNMMALACINCHLLVILSTSSPSCPNCKYVYSLPSQQSPPAPKLPVVKSLNTLSLLN